jgi:hypothetical protein
MAYPIDQRDVADLCPELRPALDAELTAGNGLAETWRGWPEAETVFVMLERPFVLDHSHLPGVTFEATEDAHYWKAALTRKRTRHMLACRFGGAIRPTSTSDAPSVSDRLGRRGAQVMCRALGTAGPLANWVHWWYCSRYRRRYLQ